MYESEGHDNVSTCVVKYTEVSRYLAVTIANFSVDPSIPGCVTKKSQFARVFKMYSRVEKPRHC